MLLSDQNEMKRNIKHNICANIPCQTLKNSLVHKFKKETTTILFTLDFTTADTRNNVVFNTQYW